MYKNIIHLKQAAIDNRITFCFQFEAHQESTWIPFDGTTQVYHQWTYASRKLTLIKRKSCNEAIRRLNEIERREIQLEERDKRKLMKTKHHSKWENLNGDLESYENAVQ